MNHDPDDATECNKCHSPIKFVLMASGNYMPVDVPMIIAKQDEVGTFVTLKGKVVKVLMKGECGYISHFATCQYADEFRKKKHG